LLSASLNSNTAAAKPEIKKRAWIFYQHDWWMSGNWWCATQWSANDTPLEIEGKMKDKSVQP
jgi:hypothetical protein